MTNKKQDRKKGPRILFYDIETAPNLAYVWGKYEQNVIAYVKEWELLTFAYKWGDEKEVHSETRLDYEGSEKKLVKSLWNVLSKADMVITHNGIQFDNKKMNAKFVEHKLPPLKPAAQIDTKSIAKRNFAFNSNKLDDLGQTLGLGRKVKHDGFDMWEGCIKGDPTAYANMARYNRQDVVLLESVYFRLRPYASTLPNMAVYSGKELGCEVCGGKTKYVGNVVVGRTERGLMKCYACGHSTKVAMGKLKVNKKVKHA